MAHNPYNTQNDKERRRRQHDEAFPELANDVRLLDAKLFEMARHMSDKNNEESTEDHWRRRFDKDIQSLHEKVSQLTSTASSVDSSLKTVFGRMDKSEQMHSDTEQRQREQSKTPWANYIATAALVLVIIGMVSSGYIRDLNRIEVSTVDNHKEIAEHVTDGHPKRVEQKVAANKEAIEYLTKEIHDNLGLFNEVRIQLEAQNERLLSQNKHVEHIEEAIKKTKVTLHELEKWNVNLHMSEGNKKQ